MKVQLSFQRGKVKNMMFGRLLKRTYQDCLVIRQDKGPLICRIEHQLGSENSLGPLTRWRNISCTSYEASPWEVNINPRYVLGPKGREDLGLDSWAECGGCRAPESKCLHVGFRKRDFSLTGEFIFPSLVQYKITIPGGPKWHRS